MKQIELLYIDLFCGAGGTSSGVEYAMYTRGQERCVHIGQILREHGDMEVARMQDTRITRQSYSNNEQRIKRIS